MEKSHGAPVVVHPAKVFQLQNPHQEAHDVAHDAYQDVVCSLFALHSTNEGLSAQNNTWQCHVNWEGRGSWKEVVVETLGSTRMSGNSKQLTEQELMQVNLKKEDFSI